MRDSVNRSTVSGMEFEDRLTIATPEGVDLELTLAGVGSRFTSALIDYLIQLAILIALALVLGLGVGLKANQSGYAAAIWIVLGFLLFVGYDICFEVLASGRTPGKRLNGLRVVLESGGPVTFPASAVRNSCCGSSTCCPAPTSSGSSRSSSRCEPAARRPRGRDARRP